MTSNDGAESRIGASEVRELHERMAAAVTQIRVRAEEEDARARRDDERDIMAKLAEIDLLDFRPSDRWVAADAFLAAFSHLKLKPGVHLACVYTASAHERQSRLVAWNAHRAPGLRLVRSEPRLPRMPTALQGYEMGVFTRSDTKPADLPDWIEWDVARGIEDDGSPDAVFERSIFNRWIHSLLNTGHGVGWPLHQVIVEPWDSVRAAVDSARSSTPERTLQVPDDWRPRVLHRVGSDDPQADLPTAPETRARLAGRRFSAVTFYSYSSYLTQSIYEHKDWFVEGAWMCAEGKEIVQGGPGYMV